MKETKKITKFTSWKPIDWMKWNKIRLISHTNERTNPFNQYKRQVHKWVRITSWNINILNTNSIEILLQVYLCDQYEVVW